MRTQAEAQPGQGRTKKRADYGGCGKAREPRHRARYSNTVPGSGRMAWLGWAGLGSPPSENSNENRARANRATQRAHEGVPPCAARPSAGLGAGRARVLAGERRAQRAGARRPRRACIVVCAIIKHLRHISTA